MKVNSEIWYSISAWSVNSQISNSSWEDTDLLWYYCYTQLSRMISQRKAAYNTPLDASICYAAHASDTKMPLADIKVYDYQCVERGHQISDNGFFFAIMNNYAVTSSEWSVYEWISQINTGSAKDTYGGAYRWSPNASSVQSGTNNPNRYLQPLVQFSPKAFFGVIYVDLVANDHSTVTTVTLKELETNLDMYKNTHYIGKAYMALYGYNGRASSGGDFNDYNIKNPKYFGISAIRPLKFPEGDVISYYQTLGRTGTLPILGVIDHLLKRTTSSGDDYGVLIYRPTSTTEGRQSWQAVVSAHLVDAISVSESATSQYTFSFHSITYITESIIEEIRKGAAAYGIFFTDDLYEHLVSDTTNTNRWVSYDMCCGILDSQGVGHGEYTRGPRNMDNTVFSWTNSQSSPYDSTLEFHNGMYCRKCGYGGEIKTLDGNRVCPRCHATGDYLIDIPAMTQGPMWKLDPDDPEYGSLYAIDVERDQTTGFTNPNLHRRVSDALEELPNGYLHLPGTHETIDYPDSEYCSVKNFDTDTILDVPTITKYNGSQKYIEMSEVFVEKGYTTIGNGCFTDTDVVYVEIPEGITTIE